MAMSTGACWVGHFYVEPGIFVSNRAFLCRTMHFAVEPGFFVSNECYNCQHTRSSLINSSPSRQNSCHCADIFKCIFTNGKFFYFDSNFTEVCF